MSKKVKILHLINGITDCGAETQLTTNLLNIDKSKFRCAVLVQGIDSRSSNTHKLLEKHIRIYAPFAIQSSFIGRVFNKIQRIIIPKSQREAYIEWYIKRIILWYRPDVIHVHMKMLEYVPLVIDKLPNTKILYRCASTPERYFNDGDCRAELNAAKYLLQRGKLQMIALHDEMRNAINHMFSINSTIVVHNVFDLNKFIHVKLTREEIRKEIGIPEDAFVVGHVGRFFYIKNQTFLVDVFKDVAKYKPKAYLLMVGNGDTSDVEDKLHEYGLGDSYIILSNRSDVNILLHAMDIFVFPSLLEGMPGALIEAQAAGVKCIASSAITSEAIVSKTAIQMDLGAGAEKWAEKILNNEFNGTPNADLMSFEVHHVMKQIEKLYMSEY